MPEPTNPESRRPARAVIPRSRRGTRALALLTALAALVFAPAPGHGVIIVTGDGTGNTSAPADDPGFDNVGVVNGLSGVYLGNGWVLTANHVGVGDIIFGGVTYPPVPASKHRIVGSGPNPPDLALLRMVGDPGLPTTALVSSAPPPGSQVVMIGRGLNRGAATTWSGIDGWAWTSPVTKRWGRNRISTTGSSFLDTESLTMNFDSAGPSAVTDEGHVAVGDSGGAVYWKSGGQWYLAGTLFVSLTFIGQPGNTSLYGNAAAAADLSVYRSEILGVITVPACNNGLDDDLDGSIDAGSDPGCDDPNDTSEQSPALICDDGLDNDLDGFIDFPADPECASLLSPSESPAVPALSAWPAALFAGALLAVGAYRARPMAGKQAPR